MRRWVQHISGQGRKWEVVDVPSEEHQGYHVVSENRKTHHWLPKSEYRECSPQQRRVTEKCVIGFNYRVGQAYLKLTATDAVSAWLPTGYHFEMLHKEELADGEICLVIEKVD